MAFSYLVPSILYLAPGTRCVVPVPWGQVADRLAEGRGRILWYVHAFCDGAQVERFERSVDFAGGKVLGEEPAPFSWDPEGTPLDNAPGYIECGMRSEDETPVFAAKNPLAFYTIYTRPGVKSYFSDNAWKYAAPPVIAQIARYGQYLDAYPAVRIDRKRDAGMSIILINPYRKAVLARLATADGRAVKRMKVAPQSARIVPLVDLLHPGETAWIGQIQITANNRLVTYITWHSLEDPRIVSDQEHLDPYRGEATHVPAFRYLRLGVGEILRDFRARVQM